MYLYFDRYGTLKEQITFNPARVGNSNVNKIFVYWEGVEEFPDWAQELALQTRYLLQDNTQYPSATTFGFSAQPETAELPFDKNQDLKYFKYYKEYKFLTIDIPDEVLSYNGAVKSYIWVLNANKKRILGLGVFAFMVDGDINEVIPDENISLAQWNMISAQLGLLSGSVIDVTCDIATNTLKVYYANGLTAIRNLPPNGAQTTISSDFLREMIFSADTWVQDGENGYYIYFRAETVGYENNRFFVQLERDGEYNSDYYNKTGSFVLSDNIFKGSDGSVLLYSNEPYSGRLLVVGGDLLSGDILVTGLTYNDVNSQLSYKTADGITHSIYLGIEQKFDKSNITQTTGDSTVKVMSQKAVTENFARLVNGKVPESQLPSYVDDVVEYDSKSDFPATGETGKIYVDKSTNLTYRWSGSTYIMIGGGDLNLENGTGTGSIQQTGITYNELITDYEPNMVAYVSYIGAGVSSPTSEQLVALLNSNKTNPYVAQILGNYTFEQYCVGFLAGTGAIQSGVSNKTAIDSLIAGALEGYGITSSSDLSNIVGKVGSAAAILGAMNKAFSPGAFAGGVGCEAGDEGYPGNSVCSFAYGSNVKNRGLAAIAAGKDLQNLGDTSAVFGSGDKEYKIEGSEVDKANRRIYLDNLTSAGGTVTGTGDDRVGITGINSGPNNFMAGTGHYIGERATNNAVVGNQNIISRSDDYSTTANNFISGLNNYINKSQLCGIIGAINKIENSAYTTLFGEGLKAKNADSGTTGVGRFNAINSNARFFVGNGASDTDRSNAFEVLKDGRAKVYGEPTESNDVIRLNEFSVLTQSQVDLLF